MFISPFVAISLYVFTDKIKHIFSDDTRQCFKRLIESINAWTASETTSNLSFARTFIPKRKATPAQ